jgi:hypothetical protein
VIDIPDFATEKITATIKPLYCANFKLTSASAENLLTIEFDVPASIHSIPKAGENSTHSAMSLNWKGTMAFQVIRKRSAFR